MALANSFSNEELGGMISADALNVSARQSDQCKERCRLSNSSFLQKQANVLGLDCRNAIHVMSLLGNEVRKRDDVIVAHVRIGVAGHFWSPEKANGRPPDVCTEGRMPG
jgi:hypothetical protein